MSEPNLIHAGIKALDAVMTGVAKGEVEPDELIKRMSIIRQLAASEHFLYTLMDPRNIRMLVRLGLNHLNVAMETIKEVDLIERLQEALDKQS